MRNINCLESDVCEVFFPFLFGEGWRVCGQGLVLAGQINGMEEKSNEMETVEDCYFSCY